VILLGWNFQLELLALTTDSLFRLDILSIARNEVLRAAIYGLVLH
jgi:hypothetical protein